MVVPANQARKKQLSRNQQGWSLPITWILLAVILVLIYFFGWKVLLYAIALFVFITLATMIHDHIVYGKEPETISYWFTSNKSLEEIGQTLEKAGLIHDHTVEGENVWEWIETGSPSGKYGVNISRRHRDHTYPVHFKVFHHDKKSSFDLREELGTRLANALHTEIRVGTVRYISGNDFEFTEEGFFRNQSSLV